MPGINPKVKSCHTCQRRRVRCDRSFPRCFKCIKAGQECLGYQRLFRWDQGIASRGKMTGKTFEDLKRSSKESDLGSFHDGDRARLLSVSRAGTSPNWSLSDPVFNDLPRVSRRYLAYFTGVVCKDLVLYDSPRYNRFYELVPQTQQHKVLLHLLTAISALHMSNAYQASFTSSKTSTSQPGTKNALGAACMTPLSTYGDKSYEDALVAKQLALRLMASSLNHLDAANIDVLLAAVLLFVEFELMESGKDHWKQHIIGARTIVHFLLQSTSTQSDPCSLRSFLLSNWLIYDILGSTLAQPEGSNVADLDDTLALSLLRYAEANNYLSCPAALLQVAVAAIRVSREEYSRTQSGQEALSAEKDSLLDAIELFVPFSWASALQTLSPQDDLAHRTHIASAHKAAMYIFVCRVVCPTSTRESEDLESRVSEIIHHVSSIPIDSPLFKATSWPTLVAGAETTNDACYKWVEARFRKLWGVLPWGYMRSALDILESLWKKKKSVLFKRPVH